MKLILIICFLLTATSAGARQKTHANTKLSLPSQPLIVSVMMWVKEVLASNPSWRFDDAYSSVESEESWDMMYIP
jgi:hypothetical protein